MYLNIPETDYRRAEGINKSGLDNLHQSPLHYMTRKLHPEADTEATHVGHAFHCLLLEPEKFPSSYVCSKYEEFRTNEAKEWKAEQEKAGKYILKAKSGKDPFWNPSEWDYVHLMRDAVMKHPIASAILQISGKAEQSLFWTDPGTQLLCKGRLDWQDFGHDFLVDVKTTMDAGITGFSRSAHSYRYANQNAFYTDGSEINKLKSNEFVFLAVEKEQPFAVACYVMNDEWIEQGRLMYRHDLRLYKECLETDSWPCYPSQIRELEMPKYARFQPFS